MTNPEGMLVNRPSCAREEGLRTEVMGDVGR